MDTSEINILKLYAFGKQIEEEHREILEDAALVGFVTMWFCSTAFLTKRGQRYCQLSRLKCWYHKIKRKKRIAKLKQMKTVLQNTEN